MKYRNHVSRNARLIESELEKNFGVPLDLIDRAISGDKKALQQIGELKRSADFASLVLPAAEEAINSHYQVTEAYNKVRANILKQGAKSGTAINKLTGDVSLTNSRYRNEKSEAQLNLRLSRHAEANRTSYAMLLARAKSQLQQYLNGVEQSATIEALENQPQLKQMVADRKLGIDEAKHYLEHGEAADPSLLPRREYDSTFAEKSSVFAKLKNLITR